MIGKIFLMVDVPFSERDHIRFGIDIFLKNKIDVVVWDIGKIINNSSYFKYRLKHKYKYENLIIFKNKSELLKKLPLIKANHTVITHFKISLKNRFLFIYFRKNRIYHGLPPTGIVPEIKSNKISIYFRLKRLFINLFFHPGYLLNSLIEKYLGFYIFNNLHPKFFIVTGYNSKNYICDTNIDLIYSHQLDYDLIIKNRVQIFKNNNLDYALFLDEYVPFHPDNQLREIDCEPDDYYEDLNNFFYNIEKKLKMRVIISAHPRSNYNDNFNPFEGREIVSENTVDLVRKSSLVLTHASTANNFTIAFKKPVFFITSKKYSDYFRNTINIFSSELNKSPIDISSHYSINLNDSFLDESTCSNYINKYLKSKNSPEINSWLIFINHLNMKFHNSSKDVC